MLTDRFWEIVDAARARTGAHPLADADEVAELVVEALTDWAPDQLASLGAAIDELQTSAYRWDLWGAAYLINGGCSDDGFEYFQGWLMAQGRQIWDATLDDPDSLADLLRGHGDVDTYSEDMLAVAGDAYARVTGDDDAYWDAVPDTVHRDRPAGDEFDFEDDEALRAHLPRLSALYLGPAGRAEAD
jgi:hypothetical protein